jgi:Trp operon repressor
MAELHMEILEEIVRGKYSFREIADRYGVPFSWVDTVASEMAAEDAAIYAVECRQ